MEPSSFIPYHRPSIGPEEVQAVTQVLQSGWLTTGPVALQFEREFAAYLGCKHSLAVNSATAALQLALDALGIGPGDEVLVPTYTFTATAAVVKHAGATPVLCDVLKGDFNLDPVDAEQRITSRTKAIMPVHIAGHPCDLDAIHALAGRRGLHVIEDAAHALPASYRGRRIGTTSELTAFSFYATKTISTGEGGMLTTDNDAYAERVRLMRLHGISGDAWKRYAKEGSWYYEVVDAGYKFNMCDVLAAIGSAQLAKCDQFGQRRTRIAKFYSETFSHYQELEIPPVPAEDILHAWHLYILRIQPSALSLDRNRFITELKNRGIGTSVHFIPLHLHPYYSQTYGYRRGDFPNAEDAFSRCMSLPIFPSMTDAEVERVAQTVKQIVSDFRIRVVSAA